MTSLGNVLGGALKDIDNEETSEMAYIIRKHKFMIDELLNDAPPDTTPKDLVDDVFKAAFDAIYPWRIHYTALQLYELLCSNDEIMELLEDTTSLLQRAGYDLALISIHPIEVNAMLERQKDAVETRQKDAVKNHNKQGIKTPELASALSHPPSSRESIHLIDCKTQRDYLIKVQSIEEKLLPYAYEAEKYYRNLVKELRGILKMSL